MKANWKLALMCVATLAFVACKGKNDPQKPDPKPDDPPAEFVSKIKVNYTTNVV